MFDTASPFRINLDLPIWARGSLLITLVCLGEWDLTILLSMHDKERNCQFVEMPSE